MAAIIFDGKSFAEEIERELVSLVKQLTEKRGKKPKLVIIANPANTLGIKYSELKEKVASRLGVDVARINLTPMGRVHEVIESLNPNPDVDGIMVQMPFYGDKDEDVKLVNNIDPAKDVDGLGEKAEFVPATARAVTVILDKVMADMGIGMAGLKIVVVGAQGMVGRPLTQLLMKSGYAVVGVDIETTDLKSVTEGADIVIGTTGQAGLIKADMVKDGVIAIDVGYPKGDFDPEIAKKAALITPVPGGVGPVTVVMLFKNLVDGLMK